MEKISALSLRRFVNEKVINNVLEIVIENKVITTKLENFAWPNKVNSLVKIIFKKCIFQKGIELNSSDSLLLMITMDNCLIKGNASIKTKTVVLFHTQANADLRIYNTDTIDIDMVKINNMIIDRSVSYAHEINLYIGKFQANSISINNLEDAHGVVWTCHVAMLDLVSKFIPTPVLTVYTDLKEYIGPKFNLTLPIN